MRTTSLALLIPALLLACDGATDGEAADEQERELGANDTWDDVRDGAHWVLAYDPSKDVFVGTVENTTDETLEAVRVVVHLSDGTRLGPTEPQDVEPGESMPVSLEVGGASFQWWTPYPDHGS